MKKKIFYIILLILFIGVVIGIAIIDNPIINLILEIIGLIILVACGIRIIAFSVKNNNKMLLIIAIIVSACSIVYALITIINHDFWTGKRGLEFILKITRYPLIFWSTFYADKKE